MPLITGRWTANLAASRRHANHQFLSAALDIEASDDRVTIVHSGVNMSGRHEEGTSTLQTDGVERPASPQTPGVAVVNSWPTPRLLESVARKDGVVVGRGTYEMSEDGRSLVAVVSGTDAAGSAFEQRIVFDRVPRVDAFMEAAIAEARTGLAEGGIPIGSVLVHGNEIVGRGHNRRIQQQSPILHGEMDALERAGRLPAKVYAESVLYTTLSPCAMCTGAILLYRIPRVVVADNVTFMGEETLLTDRGVIVDVLQEARCIAMMRQFIEDRPELWHEDIGG